MMTEKSQPKLTLDRLVKYQIEVPGQLDDRWSDWAGDASISIRMDSAGYPVSTLTITFDQAALQGLLRRLYSMGLPIISVISCPPD